MANIQNWNLIQTNKVSGTAKIKFVYLIINCIFASVESSLLIKILNKFRMDSDDDLMKCGF